MKMRSRRREFSHQRGAAIKQITLYHQKATPNEFANLSEVDRYCLLIGGHIHDELNWLQRTVLIAIQKPDIEMPVEQGARMMQITMLLRVLLGKLWEFHALFCPEQSVLRSFVTQYYDPEGPDAGSKQVNKILGLFGSETWLQTARNKHFLHYPKFSSVEDTLRDPEIEWSFEAFHGKNSANTFYPTSDVLVNYSWFRKVDKQEPIQGLQKAVDAVTALARESLDTLERSIGYFIDRRLVQFHQNDVVTLFAPDIHSLRIPYFVAV